MEPKWSFIRTLEFELGLTTEVAERVEEIVATSGHFRTKEDVQEWVDLHGEMECSRDDAVQALRDCEETLQETELELEKLRTKIFRLAKESV